MSVEKIAVGRKVYYDSFQGMIPGKIHTYYGLGNMQSGNLTFLIKITARKHPRFKLGQIVETNERHCVPRWALIRRKYGNRITAYRWEF